MQERTVVMQSLKLINYCLLLVCQKKRHSKPVIAESQENTLVACNHTEKIGGYIWFAAERDFST